MSEQFLWAKKAATGDNEAFESIVLEYEKPIYLYCLRMTNSQTEAEDLTQEVFIKVYRNLKKFKGNSKLSTWIYRIAYNTCVDASRKKKVAVCSDDYAMGKVKITSELQPDEQIILQEELDTVKKCITKLKYDYKTSVILRDIRQHTYQEISEIMDMPLGTVKANISRARRQLKNCFLKSNFKLNPKEGKKK